MIAKEIMVGHAVFSRIIGLLSLAFVIGISPISSAQTGLRPDVNYSFRLSTFSPASTPEDGLGVERARVLSPWQLSLGSTLQIDDDPLTWQRKDKSGYEVTAVAVERILALHSVVALGILETLQVGVYVPVYLDIGPSGENGGALGDIALIPKFAHRFYFDGSELGLGAILHLGAPTGNDRRLAGEGVPTARIGLCADWQKGPLALAYELGVTLRQAETEILKRGAAFDTALLAVYDFDGDEGPWSLLAEGWASTQTRDAFSRAATPVVMQGGGRYALENGLTFTAAAGTGLSSGAGAPTLRFLAQVGWITGSLKKKEPAKTDEDAPSDRDQDSILDADDACPNRPEDFDKFEDRDGCPEEDNDEDGLLDPDDACPLEPENINGLDDEDGCPEYDADEDRVPDDRDDCPGSPEDADGFEDGDGCPEEDNDFDGIPDSDDACPLLPESFNDHKDRDGCADYLDLEGDRLIPRRPILFDDENDIVDPRSHPVVDEIAAAMIANPRWELTIEVHSSGVGNHGVKRQKTAARARAISRLLVAAGILPQRIAAVGKGNTEPLESPDTREGRRANARVELRIEVTE